MLVSFNGPPGDLEYEVLFYDIHEGPRRLVQEMSTFIGDKTQKTYIQKVVYPDRDLSRTAIWKSR